MKPHQLKAFLTVMQLRSIRKAANALFITQPAISRAIRELEESLQVPLFVRGAQGVTPTEYGLAFEKRARLLEQEAERARDELRQMRDGQLGCVRVAVSSVPAMALRPCCSLRSSTSVSRLRSANAAALYWAALAAVSPETPWAPSTTGGHWVVSSTTAAAQPPHWAASCAS